MIPYVRKTYIIGTDFEASALLKLYPKTDQNCHPHMNIVTNAISKVNLCQTPVDVCDQATFALTKQI